MKKKQFIIGILVIIIVLLAVFLYLYLTRNEILYNIPGFFSDRAPTFQYYLQGDPRNPMDSPMGVAVDGTGNVYVTDADKDCVVVFDRSGQVLRMFGSSGTGNGQFNYPYGIAIHHDEVYVADKGNYRVEVFSLIGEYMRTVVQSSQSGLAGVFEPTGIAVSGKNGDIYITDLLGHRVIIFNNQGQYIRDVGSAESESGFFLSFPNGVAVDDIGNIYIADSNNARALVVSPDGKRLLHELDGENNAEGSFSLPRGIGVDSKGKVWIVDTLNHRVTAYRGNNRLLQFGDLGVDEGQLYFPNGLALDKEGRVYVTERGLNRISVFGTQAVIQQ